MYEHIVSLILYTISWIFFSELHTVMDTKLEMTRVTQGNHILFYFIVIIKHTESSLHSLLINLGSSTPLEAQHFYSRPYRSCGVRARITCGTHPQYTGTASLRRGSTASLVLAWEQECPACLYTCMQCNQHKNTLIN
jgi:hypothetical protein